MNKSLQYKFDVFIAFAIGIQSLLVILQHFLLDVVHIDEEVATTIRVGLTALTMLPAIVISAFRKPVLFMATYIIVVTILMITTLLYPANGEFIKTEALRFLLPVSIPSCLCLLTIRDYSVFEDALYKISIVTSVLVLAYTLAFFMGMFFIEGYNMSFSYGCLLPMIVLYGKENRLSKALSFALLAIVVAIGSRGAALFFLLFILADAFLFNKKQIPILIVLVFIVVAIFPFFINFLNAIDINSRTLSLLLSGEVISHDSGRNELYERFIHLIELRPFGNGLYGDRVVLDGSYCHNFFIELYYDLGIIWGTLVSLFLVVWITSVFLKSDKTNRKRILQFIVIAFIPLMTSGSFLKDYNFGLLLGVIICISRIKRNNSYYETPAHL